VKENKKLSFDVSRVFQHCAFFFPKHPLLFLHVQRELLEEQNTFAKESSSSSLLTVSISVELLFQIHFAVQLHIFEKQQKKAEQCECNETYKDMNERTANRFIDGQTNSQSPHDHH
jgi:hypothetical protein